MLCSLCYKNKLRKDFPSMDVCPKHHVEQYCLRCITEHIEQHRCCPNCDDEIPSNSKEYLACLEKLKWLFPKFDDDKDEDVLPMSPRHTRIQANANVVMLGGESAVIPFNANMKVKDFKVYVERNFGIDCQMQKLLYKEQELESYQSSCYKTMGDYKVQPDSTIQLVKILQTLSETIEHVIFDFSWGFPNPSCPDFLDASALLYSGDDFQEYVDFRNRRSGWSSGPSAVTHSGPCTRDGDRGRQRMNVSLTSLSSDIDKLFFTLSSWRSPSIASYKSPSLHFYDRSYPDKQLCSEEFDRAIDHQAVIMCSVCRVGGRWKVYSLGMPSSGNVMREKYYLLQGTIGRIIHSGIC